MTTYNSYQDAKIANPDADIYKYRDNYQSGDTPCRANERWVKCRPSGYCMTVEEFLAKGHKFVEGDVILNFNFKTELHVEFIYNEYLGAYNDPDKGDSSRYILRAAALESKMNTDRLETQSEEQPKRVKYKKLSFNSAWEAVKAFEDGNELYTKRSHKDFVLIDNAQDVLRFLYDLHIEKEITESDEFIEAIQRLQEGYILDDNYDSEQFGELLFDSGKFKLVD